MNELPLEDKEVGELWREWRSGNPKIIALIRKLVEERKQLYLRLGQTGPDREGEDLALRDFGIDPKEYNGR